MQQKWVAETEGGREVGVSPGRRRALARLGLGIVTAYTAPVLLRIQRPALAVTSFNGPCGPDPNGGPPIPCPP